MGTEKRKSPRKPMGRQAAIFEPDGKLVCQCEVLDISDSGARLLLPQKGKAPSKFVLTFSKRGNVYRKCDVVWQRELQVGVRFTGREKTAG